MRSGERVVVYEFLRIRLLTKTLAANVSSFPSGAASILST